MATISSITRESASTIGRSLNSVISRYESIKKTGFNQEDSTKLNDVVLALSQIGITATDSQGQLRDFADVMDEVGAKFSTLSKNEKAYISTTMFGTFQRNRGITLLSNYNDSLKNYENALNSAGTAEQKFAIYQESSAAKIDRFKASLETMFSNSFDSGAIKDLISLGTNLVDIISSVQKLGVGLKSLAVTLGVIFFLVKPKAWESYSTWLLNAWASTKKLNTTLKETNSTATLASDGLNKVGTASKAAALGTNVLKMALATFAPILVLTALSWIIEKVADYINRAEILTNKMNETRSSIKSDTTELKSNTELVNSYKSLSSQENLTAESKKELADATQKLAELYPGAISAYNDEGEALTLNNDKLEKYLKLKQDEIDIKKREFVQTFKANKGDIESGIEGKTGILDIDANMSDRINGTSKIEVLSARLAEQEQGLADAKWDKNKQAWQKRIAETTVELNKARAEQKTAFDQYKQGIIDNLDISDTASQLDKIARDALADSLMDNRKEIKASGSDTYDVSDSLGNSQEFVNTLNTLNSQLEQNRTNVNYTAEQYNIWAAGAVEDVTKIIKSLNPLMSDDVAKGIAVGLVNGLGQISTATTSAKTGIDSYASALQKFNKVLVDSSKQLDKLKDIKKSISESGVLTGSDVESLVEMGIEAENASDALNKIRQKEEELTKVVKKAYADKMMLSSSFYKNTILANNTLYSQMSEFYKGDLTKFSTLAEAKMAIESELIKALAKGWAQYYDSVSDMTSDDYKLIVQAAGNGNQEAKEMMSGIQRIQRMKTTMNKLAQTDFSVNLDYKTDSDKDKNTYDTDAYKIALAELNAELERLEYLKGQQIDHSQEYRNILAQEIEVEKKKQELAHGEAERLRNKIAVGGFKDLKSIEDAKEQIADLGKSWMESAEKIESTNFAIVNSRIKEFDENISIIKQDLDLLKSQESYQAQGSAEQAQAIQAVTNKTLEYIAALRAKEAQIRQDLATGNLTIAQQHELQATLRETVNAQAQLKVEIMQQLSDLADQMIDAYKKVYEQQKQEALNAIEDQVTAEERRHDEVMDNLDDELSLYEDLIDAKLKLLEAMDAERDYNKELSELQKERQELQNKLNALSLDDSEWSMSQQEDLREQLADKDSSIEDLQYDYNLDLRKQNLQDLLDSYKKEVEAKRDAEEEKYNIEKQYLEDSRTEEERYYDAMINDEERWAQLKSQIMSSTLSELQKNFSTFTSFLTSNMGTIGTSISTNLISNMQSAIALLSAYNAMGGGEISGEISTTSGSSSLPASGVGSNQWNYLQSLIAKGNQPGATQEDIGNKEWAEEEIRLKRYHEGGQITGGSRIGNLVSKLLNTKLLPSESLAIVQKGENWMPEKNIPTFLGNISSMMGSLQPAIAGNSVNNYVLNFNVDSITGDKKGVEFVFKTINQGLKKLGK